MPKDITWTYNGKQFRVGDSLNNDWEPNNIFPIVWYKKRLYKAFIKPKDMHPYSWRSQRAPQKLQLSVDVYPNDWGEPFSVETGVQSCKFPQELENEMGLISVIRALNNIQLQVCPSTGVK